MNKVIFDIGHPAHIHLFKNFSSYLIKKNLNVVWGLRNKDIILEISKYINGDKVILSRIEKSSFIGRIKEQILRDFSLYSITKSTENVIVMGTISSTSHVRLFSSRIKSFIFNEDDRKVVEFYAKHTYPLATKVIKPISLNFENGKNDVYHNSYHELAYLHPNNFTPDENILNKHKLEKKKYVILRLNSLKAHHDVGAKGISNELNIKIKEILKDYTIIESKENSKTHQIEPWDMHHVLAFAKMIICDSQTMAAEAMVLGTPSIRINTFVGRISYLEELENKYNLGYGFLPTNKNEEKILSTIHFLINDKDIETIWQNKRQIMLSDKCDLNQWMIVYFEKEINNK